jgi:hypothetical protein
LSISPRSIAAALERGGDDPFPEFRALVAALETPAARLFARYLRRPSQPFPPRDLRLTFNASAALSGAIFR